MNKVFIVIVLCSSCISFSQSPESLLLRAEEHLYTAPDSSYFYLDKLYNLSVKNEQYVAAVEALTYINYVSAYHGHFNRFQSSLKKEDAIFNTHQTEINKEEDGIYYTYYYWYDKGTFYYNLNDYNRARPYFFKILNTLENQDLAQIDEAFTSFITGAHNYVAAMYTQEAKYELADEFYKENLRLHTLFLDDNSVVNDTKNLLASLEAAKGNYAKSNTYALATLKDYNTLDISPYTNSVLSTSFLVADNYLQLQQPDSAHYILQKYKPILQQRPRFIADFLTLNGDVAFQKNDTEQALNYYYKSLKELQKGKDTYDEIALVYKKMGDVNYKNNNLIQALHNYGLGIALYGNVKDTVLEENGENPKAHNIINLLELYNAAGTVELKLGEEGNLEQTIQYGLRGIGWVQKFKRTFYDPKDKQQLIKYILPVFEHALNACYTLYKSSEDEKYIQIAFTLMEQSKSAVLLDAITGNNAYNFSNVPSTILEQEYILTKQISQLEKKVNLGKDTAVEKDLFEARRAHEQLISTLETEFPQYYQLKYGQTETKLDNQKKELPKHTAFVEIFMGAHHMYALSISQKGQVFTRNQLSKKDIQQIRKYRDMLSTSTSNLDALQSLSLAIYQRYLSALFTHKNVDYYIIVPDGLFRGIPFDSFILNEEKNSYLLQKFNVSYTPSLGILNQINKKPSDTNHLAAFAPSFASSNVFSDLNGTQEEVIGISTYFKTALYQEATASLQEFTNSSNKYNMLHLATHAKLNDEFPEYSYLAFSSKENGEELLYVNDIYSTHMNADLVCLSACETGVGALREGEGFLSLARAFFYAGTKSMVYTLWNIQDTSTSEIMIDFYKELSEGKEKDVSLRNAKLSFLKKHEGDGWMHPYYWSGFIASGNMQALVRPWWQHIYVYLVVLIIVVGLLVLARKKLL